MSFSNKLFIFLFIILSTTKIVAQDFVLDQITVSANRVFTPVNETGAIVDVIDEEIIQRRSKSIGYAIEARKAKYTNETPYEYQPFIDNDIKYMWDNKARSDLIDYNLEDLSI